MIGWLGCTEPYMPRALRVTVGATAVVIGRILRELSTVQPQSHEKSQKGGGVECALLFVSSVRSICFECALSCAFRSRLAGFG